MPKRLRIDYNVSINSIDTTIIRDPVWFRRTYPQFFCGVHGNHIIEWDLGWWRCKRVHNGKCCNGKMRNDMFELLVSAGMYTRSDIRGELRPGGKKNTQWLRPLDMPQEAGPAKPAKQAKSAKSAKPVEIQPKKTECRHLYMSINVAAFAGEYNTGTCLYCGRQRIFADDKCNHDDVDDIGIQLRCGHCGRIGFCCLTDNKGNPCFGAGNKAVEARGGAARCKFDNTGQCNNCLLTCLHMEGLTESGKCAICKKVKPFSYTGTDGQLESSQHSEYQSQPHPPFAQERLTESQISGAAAKLEASGLIDLTGLCDGTPKQHSAAPAENMMEVDTLLESEDVICQGQSKPSRETPKDLFDDCAEGIPFKDLGRPITIVADQQQPKKTQKGPVEAEEIHDIASLVASADPSARLSLAISRFKRPADSVDDEKERADFLSFCAKGGPFRPLLITTIAGQKQPLAGWPSEKGPMEPDPVFAPTAPNTPTHGAPPEAHPLWNAMFDADPGPLLKGPELIEHPFQPPCDPCCDECRGRLTVFHMSTPAGAPEPKRMCLGCAFAYPDLCTGKELTIKGGIPIGLQAAHDTKDRIEQYALGRKGVWFGGLLIDYTWHMLIASGVQIDMSVLFEIVGEIGDVVLGLVYGLLTAMTAFARIEGFLSGVQIKNPETRQDLIDAVYDTWCDYLGLCATVSAGVFRPQNQKPRPPVRLVSEATTRRIGKKVAAIREAVGDAIYLAKTPEDAAEAISVLTDALYNSTRFPGLMILFFEKPPPIVPVYLHRYTLPKLESGGVDYDIVAEVTLLVFRELLWSLAGLEGPGFTPQFPVNAEFARKLMDDICRVYKKHPVIIKGLNKAAIERYGNVYDEPVFRILLCGFKRWLMKEKREPLEGPLDFMGLCETIHIPEVKALRDAILGLLVHEPDPNRIFIKGVAASMFSSIMEQQTTPESQEARAEQICEWIKFVCMFWLARLLGTEWPEYTKQRIENMRVHPATRKLMLSFDVWFSVNQVAFPRSFPT